MRWSVQSRSFVGDGSKMKRYRARIEASTTAFIEKEAFFFLSICPIKNPTIVTYSAGIVHSLIYPFRVVLV